MNAPQRMLPAPRLPPVLERPLERDGPLENLHALIQRISEIHREQIESSAALHRRFLALMRPPRAEESARAVYPGPRFSRAQLENLPAGKISSLLGPRFACTVPRRNQIRLPRPPLLIVDHILGIEGEPGSLKKGAIWSETILKEDSLLLDHCGRMHASLLVEATQASLVLASYLGGDLRHQDDRLCRLLEFVLEVHGPLPRQGDALSAQIRYEDAAETGSATLFPGSVELRAAGAKIASSPRFATGLFAAAELGRASASWNPAAPGHPLEGELDPPALRCERREFPREAVRAFASGDAYSCFGAAFKRAATHVRSPRIPSDDMRMIDSVSAFDPRGGPWERGYLRAEAAIDPDAWYFTAHFPGDPCMPGFLMLEGCLQGMMFSLAALGFTADRDGWRFEPAPGRRYELKFSSQITPRDRRVVFEVFIESARRGPPPTLTADLVCSVDGRQVFHARRFEMRLVPDWPLDAWRRGAFQAPGKPFPLPELGGLDGHADPTPAARLDRRQFGYPELLAAAWGRLADAFGPEYARFDGPNRLPRLPGPPFLFLTRISKIAAEENRLAVGSSAEAEYDVPLSAWYFAPNAEAVLPFTVLLEALLQPCGWLTTFMSLKGNMFEGDVYYRNLDGRVTVLGEIRPSERLRTKSTLTSFSNAGETRLFGFRVEGFVENRRVCQIETMFGLFPKGDLQKQVGLPATPAQAERARSPGGFHVDLKTRPPRYFRDRPALPDSMLLMLDRISAYDPNGGRAGLGYARGELDVDPRSWFFKSHFLNDPVQPGSLGIEALCQLLQFFMIEKDLGKGLAGARFESLAQGRPMRWKYRGQVLPENKRVTTEIDVTETGSDAKGAFAAAAGRLWVDDVCVYEVEGLALRITAGAAEESEETLDPATDRWLADHCPTWTIPVMPILSMADRLASAAQSRMKRTVTGISHLQVHRFLSFPAGPIRTRVRLEKIADDRARAVLLAWRQARTDRLSRFDPVATAEIHFEPNGLPPKPLHPVRGKALANPYEAATVFHGPAFHTVISGRSNAEGSSGTLRVDRCGVPRGVLNPGVLDAVFHIVRVDEPWRTWPAAPRDRMSLPHRIESLRLHAPLDPNLNEVRMEARPGPLQGDLAPIDMQLIVGDAVIAEMRVTMILLPMPLASAAPKERRAFLRDKIYVPDTGLSRWESGVTTLDAETIRRVDWIPGNVAAAYAVDASRLDDLTAEVAVRDHVARQARCHPSLVRFIETVPSGEAQAWTTIRPETRYVLRIERTAAGVVVKNA